MKRIGIIQRRTQRTCGQKNSRFGRVGRTTQVECGKVATPESGVLVVWVRYTNGKRARTNVTLGCLNANKREIAILVDTSKNCVRAE